MTTFHAITTHNAAAQGYWRWTTSSPGETREAFTQRAIDSIADNDRSLTQNRDTLSIYADTAIKNLRIVTNEDLPAFGIAASDEAPDDNHGLLCAWCGEDGFADLPILHQHRNTCDYSPLKGETK